MKDFISLLIFIQWLDLVLIFVWIVVIILLPFKWRVIIMILLFVFVASQILLAIFGFHDSIIYEVLKGLRVLN